ncbi:MAG: hypothetical protein HFI35_14385 [Roseburia sp.]|jgi:hypothetical protein|nr:hypothetical protein [Roseburia sp.]
MKKAVILIIHTEINYCNMFIQQLIKDGTTDVFVHVNANVNELKEKIIKSDCVHIVKNNVIIDWGSPGLMQAIIESWKEVMNYGAFDYIITCSGQDILLREGLDDFLLNHPREIFIDAYEDDKNRRVLLLNNWPKFYFRRIDCKFNPVRIMRRLRIEILKAGFSFGKRKISYDVNKIVFYKNYFWSVIPAEVIQWILDYLKEYPEYWDVFNGAVPEEGFIATTIMLSPYKEWIKYDNGISHSLTFIKPFYNNHPQLLLAEDIKAAETSGLFFGRKIDPVKSFQFINYFYDKQADK